MPESNEAEANNSESYEPEIKKSGSKKESSKVETLLTERGLERRLKRHVMKATHEFFAVCIPGLEKLCKAELDALDVPFETIEIEHGGVKFTGGLELIYHSNLNLRIAHRILLRMDSFLAQNLPMLYNKARKIPWEHYIGFGEDLRLHSTARKSKLNHHENLQRTTHDAILARMQPLGREPIINDASKIDFQLRLYQDRCYISLNTSGDHLHKRGYRITQGKAPIRESLAAALLMLSDWQEHDLIYDSMCGSGTLIIEAASLARKLPLAAVTEREFSFEASPFFQESRWQRLKKTALEKSLDASPIKLIASDIDPEVLEKAEQNASTATVDTDISFFQADIQDLNLRNLDLSSDRTTVDAFSKAKSPLFVVNPPYGERLGDKKEAHYLYQKLINLLPKDSHLAVITPHPEAFEHPDLNIQKRHKLQNAQLDTVFLKAQKLT